MSTRCATMREEQDLIEEDLDYALTLRERAIESRRVALLYRVTLPMLRRGIESFIKKGSTKVFHFHPDLLHSAHEMRRSGWITNEEYRLIQTIEDQIESLSEEAWEDDSWWDDDSSRWDDYDRLDPTHRELIFLRKRCDYSYFRTSSKSYRRNKRRALIADRRHTRRVLLAV